MKLSRDEELFLRCWMYDEAHFLSGVGPAKRLQVEHQVAPADLALLVAATIPDPIEQARAAEAPGAVTPRWPWDTATFRARVVEAREALASRALSVRN